MAIVRAVKTGNWSDTTVWNTGALPTTADDVYSSTFTVTIDVSPTVLSISNASTTGVTAGGSFVPTNGITLTCTGAGVVGATVGAWCFDSSLPAGSSCSIVGAIVGTGTSNQSTAVVRNSSGGTVNITGNISFTTTGSGVQYYGVTNTSNGIVNITGNITGGSLSANYGALNNSTGTINITGNATAGANSNGHAIFNNSSGIVNHVGSVIASSSGAAIGIGSTTQVTILTGPLICSTSNDASSGINPCIAQRWFPADSALSTFRYEMRSQTTSGSPAVRAARNLYLSQAYDALYPATSNVRSGITYAPDSRAGTCAVPPAGSVALGVPVDATTGTAAITADSIRSAVGLASANLDTQLDALPTAGETAAAVWGASAASYTINGTFGASVLIGSSAQREVAVTGSHHVAADIHELQPAVISAGDFAAGALDGVRTSIGMASANLDTQLARIPNTATTQEVADIVEGALAP